MSIYLTKARYSHDAFKGMMAKPENRESVAKTMFGAAGMTLHHIWYSADGDIVCIVEGKATSGAAVGMVTMTSGASTRVESTELLTMGQMLEAMGSAGAIAAKYRAPGK